MSADEARVREAGRNPSAKVGVSRDPANGQLDPIVNDTIGRRLQAHYKALAEEPLPDRILVLLAQLRAKELER